MLGVMLSHIHVYARTHTQIYAHNGKKLHEKKIAIKINGRKKIYGIKANNLK